MSEPQDGVRFVTVHGHRRAYVMVGEGPALLLLHGLGCDHTTWNPVIPQLAEHYTVIAPDLLGHGQSDKPRADYSLGGYANGMRDLLAILGIDKATVVGHSFGGGVAMQFAYQFPERLQRLVLVATGGLGPEVSAVLRVLTMPGARELMGVAALPGVRHVARALCFGLVRTGAVATRDLGELAAILDTWRDPAARRATRHLVRNVVDLRGQIVTMRDRAYLAQAVPLCVIWGSEDVVLPVDHVEVARELTPTARIEVIPDAGHFPHKADPELFVKILHDFIGSTKPAVYRRATWRALLVNGAQDELPVVDSERKLSAVTEIA